jgi:hypothetical protein
VDELELSDPVSLWRMVLVAGGCLALLAALAACEVIGLGDEEDDRQTPEPIPSGAQQVQIMLTRGGAQDANAPGPWDVELTPDTVRAGDVYLVLGDGAVSFVERQIAPGASPGPLTDGQIARIRHTADDCPGRLGSCLHNYDRRHPNVTKDTVVSDLEAGYCDSRNDPARGVRGGTHCLVMPIQVRPGRYLIMFGVPPIDGSAVLTVTP